MTDLRMKSRPGYTGKLNKVILERVRYVSSELGLSDLEDRFPHLKVNDDSWRQITPITDDSDLAPYIDHTQLKADATDTMIQTLCAEAVSSRFVAVCVNGHYVNLSKKFVGNTGTRVASVVGFPLGQTTTAVKVAEARDEVANGALDIDMVINVAEVKNKNYEYVYREIKAVCDACPPGVTTKVILEVCLLTETEIIDACIMAVAAGANFVKTSTGFSTGGATPEAVDIMLAVVGNSALVKASGGVRDRATALQYIQAGVRRIGTSAGVAICSGK